MLFHFLMEDVGRKQTGRAQREAGQEEEFVESSTGDLILNSRKSAGLSRSKSMPKRKDAFHYPLRAVRRNSVDEASLPDSPQLPEFAKMKMMEGEVKRGENRLTM